MEDILLYSSLSSLLLLFIAFKIFLQTRPQRKHLPPSPPCLPILGHLHLLKKPLHHTFHHLSQKYGHVFSLRFASKLVVIISSPSTVEECFTKNDIVLANRPRFSVGRHLGYNYTTLVSAPYGDHWRNLRRINGLEIFSTNRLNMFLGIRRDEIKHLLRKLSNNSTQGFAKVELKSMFPELTFNIIMRMVGGKRYYGEDMKDVEEARQFREIMNEIVKLAGASNPGEFVAVLWWIDHGGLEIKLKGLAKRMDVFLQSLVDEVRKKEEEGNTMIDHLLSLQKSQPEYYTDQIIKGLTMVLILAGTDTSAVILEWVMSNLINHPNVLKKARVDLDNQIGQEKLIIKPDVSKLHYLQCIISETFDCTLLPPCQYLISLLMIVPSEDMIYHVTQFYCSMHRPCIEILNCRKILLVLNLKGLKLVNATHIIKLMPFGLGRRACPRAGLAQRTVSLTLGSLIQCFEWERVTNEKFDMTEGNGICQKSYHWKPCVKPALSCIRFFPCLCMMFELYLGFLESSLAIFAK